jgi:hypothetical protein
MKAAISVAGLTGRNRGRFVLDDVSLGSRKRIAP